MATEPGAPPVRGEQETTLFCTCEGGGKTDWHEFSATCHYAVGSAHVRAEAAKTEPDAVCQHGTAMDVHCCHCHSGFIFDRDHQCPATADEWREAIETALGVEPDAENHTPEWAGELVQSIREIGNSASPVREAEPKESHEEVAAGVLVAGVRRDSPCGDSRAGDSAARYGEAVGLWEAEPLKALVAKWRARAEGLDEHGYYARPEIAQRVEECADELAAALEGAATKGPNQ